MSALVDDLRACFCSRLDERPSPVRRAREATMPREQQRRSSEFALDSAVEAMLACAHAARRQTSAARR